MGAEQQKMSGPRQPQYYANMPAPNNNLRAYPSSNPPVAAAPALPPRPVSGYHPFGSSNNPSAIDASNMYAAPQPFLDNNDPNAFAASAPPPVYDAPANSYPVLQPYAAAPAPAVGYQAGPLPPPPAYTSPAPDVYGAAAQAPRPNAQGVFANAKMTKEQAAGRDYVLLLDISGSMNTEDCPNDNSRFKEAGEGVMAFADMMDRLDPDGIDLCLFNDEAKWFRNCHKDDVEQVFESVGPRGGTLLAPVLQEALLAWLETRKRPITVVIVTDGQPQDKKEVLDTLVTASKRLAEVGGRDEDIGISFIQIGYDKGATAFLKELDDDLQSKYGAPFDIVDTCPMTEVAKRGGIKQVLLNAVAD